MPQGEETYRSSFGPFVRVRYSWRLIFSSMRRYLLERVESARCDLSAAWFLHFSDVPVLFELLSGWNILRVSACFAVAIAVLGL
jgi:hypothetical protein